MADILASVTVALGAEISEFKAKMAEARRELKGLVQFSEGLKDIGQSLTTYVTAPLTLMAGAALKVGGDFQAAFNRVEAATQSSGAELDALRKKAQGIALDPTLQFSSVQAAQALENLSKNGASVADILGGAVDATTALATATGGQLATAADIATDVLNNFNRKASELPALVSNITGTTIASKLSIDDYRLALGQAGGVAGQLGVSLEDFNTALGLTSSGFSSGQDAGTSFKTFLQRLVPQSKEAEKAIQTLGLNFFDAQGKMRPLRDIAGQLQQAFKNLSDQQRNALGTQVFGADAIRTALLLAKQGAAGFDKMAESIGKVNAAAQGGILNKGFVGAKEAFKSAAEGAAQAIADSGILAAGTKLAQIGADIASSIATADPALLQFGVGLAAAAAAAGPLLLALGSVGAALPLLEGGLLLLTGPVGLVAAAVAGAALLIVSNWDELVAYFKPTGEGGRIFSNLAASVTDSVGVIGEALRGIANLGGDTFGGLISSGEFFRTLFREIAVGITAFSDVVGGVIGAVVKLIKGDFGGALEEAKRAVVGLAAPLANLFGFTQKTATELQGLKGSFDSALRGAFAGAPDAVGDFSQALDFFGVQVKKTSAITDEQAKALAKLREELRLIDLYAKALGSTYDRVGERSQALENGIKSLVAVGFAPQGKTVLGLTQQLRELGGAYKFVEDSIAPIAGALVLPKAGKADALPLALKPVKLEGDAHLKPYYDREDEAAQKFAQNFQQILAAGMANAAATIGTELGNVISGTKSLGDGLQAVFNGLLGIVADFITDYGKLLITQGTLTLAATTLAKSPQTAPAAIAVGIAAVAAGAALRSFASGGAFGGAAGGGASSGAPSVANYGQSSTPQTLKVEVVGTLRGAGKDLIAVIEAGNYRRFRTA